ncbi:MAG TPA: helix-turn-helix domain-containing protein [Actinophytocola sp.]|nr:helix-turn-helix domain-containing protein [Actinophytocola sp.]
MPTPNRRGGAEEDWPDVMLATEVAEYLRVSYATVLRMTKAGELPAIRVGREFRYLRSEIDKMMRQPARPGDEGASAAG